MAQNVVQLGLQEFGMSEQRSGDWCLTKVTVTQEDVSKQSRLPDQIQNLAEKMDLNSRYYLKKKEQKFGGTCKGPVGARNSEGGGDSTASVECCHTRGA